MRIIFINQVAMRLRDRLRMTAFMFVVVISGCYTDRFPDERYRPGVGGEILTEDRNSDGIVDREYHAYAGADMNWEYLDDDFDGVYEKLVKYGFALKVTDVHVPVPKKYREVSE